MMEKKRRVAAALVAVLAIQTASAVTGSEVIKPLTNVICDIFGTLIPTGIALMMGAYAAILWVYSREDPAMREKAKKVLLLVFVGLVVVKIAKPLAAIVIPEAGSICP